jgi:DNA mismatch repair protein MutL
MMSQQQIHILPKSVAERIAAGEVVERPASVVKELIENAIDAGAGAISIEIREGGVALIRVSDNGRGMSRQDAALALERFATSKIATEKDLNAVRTLGFRGEALPSIASVSQLELLTRARDPSTTASPGSASAQDASTAASTRSASAQDASTPASTSSAAAQDIEGTRVRRVGGEAGAVEVAGAPVGTQVTVRNLFYNAPARRKFLKAPLRETELIQKTVMLYALAYPQIAFRLVVDGRENLVAPAATPLERIGAVWGREVAVEMLEIDYTSIDLSVRGYASRPPLARASREWQTFFVNGRPVRSGLLAVMLERPYAGRIPPNRHPLAVVKIDLDPQLLDVNVHPRKSEVRFYQERAIYGAVAQALEGALREFPTTNQASTVNWPFAGVATGGVAGEPGVAAEPGSAGTPAPALREPQADYGAANWRASAQIHNTYILAQSAEGMVIVDQHAAQEQIFYEWLTMNPSYVPPSEGGREGGGAQIQVTPKEAELLDEHLEEYRALGIETEPFGENTFRVNVLPPFIRMAPQELLAALLQEHERYRALDGEALRDKLAAKAACVSAIKAGDALDHEQQQALLDQLLQAYAPATCPHGRPVFVMLRLEELERRFLRR